MLEETVRDHRHECMTVKAPPGARTGRDRVPLSAAGAPSPIANAKSSSLGKPAISSAPERFLCKARLVLASRVTARFRKMGAPSRQLPAG